MLSRSGDSDRGDLSGKATQGRRVQVARHTEQIVNPFKLFHLFSFLLENFPSPIHHRHRLRCKDTVKTNRFAEGPA